MYILSKTTITYKNLYDNYNNKILVWYLTFS